jgi:hypothetical protein
MKMRRNLVLCMGITILGARSHGDVVSWFADKPNTLGESTATVKGAPRSHAEHGKTFLTFDGAHDGLFFKTNPIQGAKTFTVEALFRPSATGNPEQRFVHIQETNSSNRVLLETRVTPKGWYADTFIQSGETKSTLIDPALLHPLGQWQTLAVVFDGTHMIQYVNGKRELSAAITAVPFGDAQVSIGCRINEVFWFKGDIQQVRFTPSALKVTELLKP